MMAGSVFLFKHQRGQQYFVQLTMACLCARTHIMGHDAGPLMLQAFAAVAQ